MPPKADVAQINKDILEIAMQPHLRKWFVGTPEQEAKKRNTNAKSTSKRGRMSQKRGRRPRDPLVDLPDNDAVEDVTQDLDGGLLEEIDEAEVVLSEADTTVEVAAADGRNDDTDTVVEDGEEEEEEEEITRPAKKQKVVLVEIAAYVDVIPAARTLKAKEVAITYGPFLFTVETKHDDFLQGVVSCATSKGQSHSITSINQSQLYWKFNVPLNDKKKPLSTVVGYQALISSVKTRLQDAKGKTKDNTITLTMPPLSKRDIRVSSDGDTEDEEFKSGPAGSTIREQQAVIGQTHAPTIERLRQKYLLGADPRFPNKRVYCAPDKRIWELNNIRLTVWAQAIDNGVTSFDAPPNSTHFSDSQKLRVASNVPEMPAASIPGASTHTQGPGFLPHLHNFSGYPSYYPPYAPPPYPYYPPYYHPPPDPGATAHVSAPSFHGPRVDVSVPAPKPGSPRKVTLPRVVLLAEFCQYYKIDDEDQARLAKLRFLPGNRRVEKLGREDWHDHAGFEKLAWEDFLDKHNVFIRDVEAGCWA